MTSRSRPRRNAASSVGDSAAAGNGTDSAKDPFLLGGFRFNPKWVHKPWSNNYFKWLVIISCGVWYNLIFVLARTCFHELQEAPQVYVFVFFDYFCDLLFIIDIYMKATTGYLENGILIKEPRKLFQHYFKSKTFILDVLSVAPTDLLWLATGWAAPFPIFRINRLLKLPRVGEFYYRAQTRLDSPNTFRLIYLILTMVVVVHLNACVYYGVSSLIGIGSNRWAYPGRAGWRFQSGHGGGHEAAAGEHGAAAGEAHGTAAHGSDPSGHGLSETDDRGLPSNTSELAHGPETGEHEPDSSQLSSSHDEAISLPVDVTSTQSADTEGAPRQKRDVFLESSLSNALNGFLARPQDQLMTSMQRGTTVSALTRSPPGRGRTVRSTATTKMSDVDRADVTIQETDSPAFQTTLEPHFEAGRGWVTGPEASVTDSSIISGFQNPNNPAVQSHFEAGRGWVVGPEASVVSSSTAVEHQETTTFGPHFEAGKGWVTGPEASTTDSSISSEPAHVNDAQAVAAARLDGLDGVTVDVAPSHASDAEQARRAERIIESQHVVPAAAVHSTGSTHSPAVSHVSTHRTASTPDGNAQHFPAEGHSTDNAPHSADNKLLGVETDHPTSHVAEEGLLNLDTDGHISDSRETSSNTDSHDNGTTSDHGDGEAALESNSHETADNGTHAASAGEHGAGSSDGGHDGDHAEEHSGTGEGGHSEEHGVEGEHGGGGEEHAAGGEHAAAASHTKPLIYDPMFINDTLLKKYSYSLYWSVKMMTSKPYEIFNPTSNIEFIFHIADAFLGIFMFASIVGEVDGIIESINKQSDDFKSHLDSVKQYISMRKVGKEMESRVVKWFDYIWANNGQLDEESVLSVLPEPLRMEIARHVHLEVLKKVPIFQGVDEQFLIELAEKLKFEAFCPGDYVCRKGDIGREIYVLRRGLLNVIAADGVKVIVTLKSGVVFGELSLLNVPGSLNGNRRTVTVRSVGYADLFSLSKENFWNCLEEYPEVKDQLMEKARAILKKDNLINEDAARETARRGRNFQLVADKMENGLENVNTRMERFWKEQIGINMQLIMSLERMEKAVKKPRRPRPRLPKPPVEPPIVTITMESNDSQITADDPVNADEPVSADNPFTAEEAKAADEPSTSQV